MTTKQIIIRRNTELHCWVIVGSEAEQKTPWADTASAVSVSTWLKSKHDGVVKVEVR
jgi:hypothetical protein